MREIKKISLIGLGAIGGTYASKLQDMEPGCLRIIVNQERYERLQRTGFEVRGKGYAFNYVRPEEAVEPADLIIVSVKYHHLQQAIQDIRNHVGEDTIILSLMNGISSEQQLGEVYGMEKVLYGMVLSIDAERERNKIIYADTATIYFGEGNNRQLSSKVEAVKALFDRAGIKYIIPDDMLHTLWWKFMFNVGINQTSAVLKAPYKVFQQVHEAEAFLRAAMEEVLVLAQKDGIGLTADSIDEFVNLVKRQSPESRTSMLQDIEAGRKTEVEMLAGTVCELGKKHGVDTPINQMLFYMIRTMEKIQQI